MKKTIVLIMAIAIMAASVGCGSSKTSSNGETSGVSSNSENSHGKEETKARTIKVVPDTEKEPTTYDFDGVSVSLPEGFEADVIQSFLTWEGKQNTDDEIYFMIAKDTMNDYPADLTLQDAIVKMEDWIYVAVKSEFGTKLSKYKKAADKTEDIEIAGVKYQKMTGSIHADDGKNVTELKYIAYYSLSEYPKINRVNIPTVMMTLSEAKDDKTVDEMSKILDNAINNLGEYKGE